MVESLFPNYLFVRFELSSMLSEVKYTSGVSHVLQFGGRYPTIADDIIENLQTSFAQEELQLSSDLPVEGDSVVIADKAFWGMQAVVLRVMPAQDRIRVLIEMLGRATAIELRLGSVVPALQPLPRPLLNA
ncbi:MAG: nusG [Verrucomicrobiales bacterium]|nr:nusG [Verrucomicrobiales bacterium]